MYELKKKEEKRIEGRERGVKMRTMPQTTLKICSSQVIKFNGEEELDERKSENLIILFYYKVID